MTDHANELRRYSRKIGHPAGDVPSVMLAAADEIERLAAMLEAAEKERDALRGKAEAVEKNLRCCQAEREEAAALFLSIKTRLTEERDALRAKVEAMEQQEPVRHEFQGRDGTWHPFIDQRHYENTVADGSWPIRALYIAPGTTG